MVDQKCVDFYKELEGCVIEHKGTGLRGLIVGCDIDVGLTIVAENDHTHYLTCFNGPMSEMWKHFPDMETVEEAKLRFALFVDEILMTGVADLTGLYLKWNDSLVCGPNASAETCAFT